MIVILPSLSSIFLQESPLLTSEYECSSAVFFFDVADHIFFSFSAFGLVATHQFLTGVAQQRIQVNVTGVRQMYVLWSVNIIFRVVKLFILTFGAKCPKGHHNYVLHRCHLAMFSHMTLGHEAFCEKTGMHYGIPPSWWR